MEKYGVEEQLPVDKTASDLGKCPTCGTPLKEREDTGVLLCPRCGSRPFENE